MIVPNVTQHTPFPYTPGVTGPSGTGPTTTPPASSATDTAASSSSPASPSATGSGDVFSELSGLVQQFLLQLQNHGPNGQDDSGQSKGTTLNTSGSATSGIVVEGATTGRSAAQSLFGTSNPAVPNSTGNTNGQASNDTMLGRIVSALQAYAANGATGASSS